MPEIECESCGDGCSEGVTVEEKDPPGQLIMMCDHQTVTYPLAEYDAEHLPPQSDLPNDWVTQPA